MNGRCSNEHRRSLLEQQCAYLHVWCNGGHLRIDVGHAANQGPHAGPHDRQAVDVPTQGLCQSRGSIQHLQGAVNHAVVVMDDLET